MLNENDLRARQKFQNRITKGMLGPGSDTWGLEEKEEIISDYPLQRYFTGILFPKSEKIYSDTEADDKEVEAETLGEQGEDEYIQENIDDVTEKDEPNENKKEKNEDYEKISQNNFFPNNIGLTVCVANSTKEIDVTFSFGVYFQPKLSETKIKISEKGFKSFSDSQIPIQLSFKDKLKFDGKFMCLKRELEGKASKGRSEDYKSFDEFKKQKEFSKFDASNFVWKLEKLLGRKWKRREIEIRKKIKIEDQLSSPLELSFLSHKSLKVSFSVKTYTFKGLQFVKIQLVNNSDNHPRNKFSNLNEILNSKCFFQSKIKIESSNIVPYKNYREEFPFDEEAEKLNFIYREIKNYGVGHNCSITWNGDNPKEIESTFLPTIDIPDTKNDLEHLKDSRLDKILMIKNLSIFGFDKNETIQELRYFVSKYEDWINEQSIQKEKLESSDKETASVIIGKQKENLHRLESNIELLEKNEEAFQTFQLSNLAMFIQLFISNDKDFAKEEKDLIDLKEEVEYDDLNYFLNFNFEAKSESKEPKYRPFQLAFLLLNIDGIVNKESKSRKEIVDLIWFPTGGGKTEAYFAVTAFTIIWRRLTNETKFDGISVIMRYTLRLLTAQQFERASRLIAVLDFLRQQEEFKKILKDKQISIGLWIGQSSTPNTLKVAFKSIDEIDKECKPTGNPRSKNKFQISSCPWCGTKIISKISNGNWDSGFRKRRKTLKICCLNGKCPFKNEIPVNVVDELLYETPPTLLFGTVDKFAQLAWQEGPLSFFGKLPPDLIIQDELHLLSGPLGSITGIFESVIEILCMKNGIAPKVIASTATTRNTNEQVGKLYGNRTVNIFPPTGINYNDSFFAKESQEQGKRRYFGFLPTGKTALITQLQILSHLLVARLENYSENVSDMENVNNYWTIVSYYNSLKDVGKTYNKVGDEIKTGTSQLQIRLKSILKENFYFNYSGLINRTKELTSRIESEKIKSTLKELEENFTQEKFSTDKVYLNNVIDLVLATNMISVGIDINRLNIMLMNGMPKNVAEYIQASSRVGRKTFGLVVTLLDANRPREKSYFEHFQPFHRAFYKSVEPLSVTPFTENTISKMLSSLLVSFVRQYYPELNGEDQAKDFTKEKIIPLVDFLKIRFASDEEELKFFINEINRVADDWISKTKTEIADLKKYKELLKEPDSKTKENKNNDWVTMNSMREIDTNTFIRIKER
ncbi:MAG: helicase [Calditrichaeota bacterium]|nr:MAG: helicase [Calditrichota bacterium]